MPLRAAPFLPNAKTQGGKGGDVSLITNYYDNSIVHGSPVLRIPRRWCSMAKSAPYGFDGGGSFMLSAPQKIIIGGNGPAVAGELNLDTGRFETGFTHYDITGSDGIEIHEGTQVAPVVPVYRFTTASYACTDRQPAGRVSSGCRRLIWQILHRQDNAAHRR